MSEIYKTTFTEGLRTRLRSAFGVCPTCGQPTEHSTREIADEIGLSHTTLWRFLKGKKPSADVVDRLVDWLDEHEKSA
jgi:transcriptional regulator with XRE-family HTH domain